ncbi:MAG: choice-of-anchor L domain-containing protein [Myxococcota bacterium]
MTSSVAHVASLLVLPCLLPACNDDGGDSPFGVPTTTADGATSNPGASGGGPGSADDTAGTEGGSASDSNPGGDTTGFLFDIGNDETGIFPGDCEAVIHTPCDAGTDDPFHAMGLGCAGETEIVSSIDAHPDGLGILTSFGADGTYAPREGSSYVVLSTGHVAELGDEPTGPGDQINHCNDWFSPGDGMNTATFPAPIQAQNVGGDCMANPGLVGTGDCSNTIQDQFSQSGFKYDYQELRISLTVPDDAHALSFDVAYLTTEWPVFAGQPYNDMFLAWLEGPSWSGNISYDDGGNALSLNAAFFDYQDTNGDLPQFSGTCMRYGAGTPWLTSTAAVEPGEEIELVFAVFDLDDVNLNSMVFLDNFRFQCEGGGGPVTEPAG